MSKSSCTKPPMPGGEPEPASTGSVNDPVTALAALYQGEKTDSAYIFSTAMAMMGVAVAYLIGAMPFVRSLSQEPMGWLLLLLLPIPLWLVVAFHSLITFNAMTHAISISIIEDALFKASKLRVRRDLVGSAAGEKIMDIRQAKAAHKVTTVVVYGGVALLVMGFTTYAVYSATELSKRNVALAQSPVLPIAIVTYSLLLIVVGWSWFEGFRIIKEGHAEVAKYK